MLMPHNTHTWERKGLQGLRCFQPLQGIPARPSFPANIQIHVSKFQLADSLSRQATAGYGYGYGYAQIASPYGTIDWWMWQINGGDKIMTNMESRTNLDAWFSQDVEYTCGSKSCMCTCESKMYTCMCVYMYTRMWMRLHKNVCTRTDLNALLSLRSLGSCSQHQNQQSVKIKPYHQKN
jgi:hypothetical protein